MCGDRKVMDYQMQRVMFSSMNGYARTPKDLFNLLDSEFHFTLDVCADPLFPLKDYNDKFTGWFGEYGLKSYWTPHTVWMNPPYGNEITKWLDKADCERAFMKTTTVALLPARTDTNWFWKYCLQKEIRLIKGRVRFQNYPNGAPFPSMIVIFK